MQLLLTRPDWTSSTIGDRTVHQLRGPGAALATVIVDAVGMELHQDPIRSFPLFYSIDANGPVAGDDVQTLVRHLGAHGAAPRAAAEFRHLGFVTGAATLHPGIKQVQAGEHVALSAAGGFSARVTRFIGATGDDVTDPHEADELFHRALREAFIPLLESLDGRQVVVPLSGGLDSRLIATLLKELGYENLVHFTYGTGPTRESRISADVASSLGQRWIFVPYDVGMMRAAWEKPAAADFVAAAYSGSALPHFQDWFALRHLRMNSLIDEDAVFLPGHTVVGNMHDEGVLDSPGEFTAAELRAVILRHHGVLRRDSTAALSRMPEFMAGLDDHLALIGYDGSPEARLIALESWNLRERQTKYINNSMRTYEHFGYQWALPMLEEPVMHAWESLAPALRRNRDWYESFVDSRYHEASGESLKTFAPTSIDATTRNRLKAVLRSTGLLTLAERSASARAYSNHPMGFQAFVPERLEGRLTRILLRGGHPMALFADLFLADDWTPAQHLFD